MGSPQSVYSVFHLTFHPWRILQLFCPILGPLCLHFDSPSSSPLHDEDLPPQDLLTRKPHDIAPTTWGTSRPLHFLRTLAPSLEPSFETLSWEPWETQEGQCCMLTHSSGEGREKRKGKYLRGGNHKTSNLVWERKEKSSHSCKGILQLYRCA